MRENISPHAKYQIARILILDINGFSPEEFRNTKVNVAAP